MDRKKLPFAFSFFQSRLLILGSPATYFQCSRGKCEEVSCTHVIYHDCGQCDDQTQAGCRLAWMSYHLTKGAETKPMRMGYGGGDQH